jgi:hypothetical protein
MSPDPTPGHLFAGSQNTAVLRFPLPPALPIPLGIAAPGGVTLATWAFSGLEEGAVGGPVCLLAVEGTTGGDLTLATHFRDIPIRPEPRAPDVLSAAERALLARALLSAGPSGLTVLAGLLPLVETALAAFTPAADAPALLPEESGYALTGKDVPHALLLRSEAGWGCARVKRARLGFAGGPRVGLALDPLWGTPPTSARAAFALHAHGFVPLAVRAA